MKINEALYIDYQLTISYVPSLYGLWMLVDATVVTPVPACRYAKHCGRFTRARTVQGLAYQAVMLPRWPCWRIAVDKGLVIRKVDKGLKHANNVSIWLWFDCA